MSNSGARRHIPTTVAWILGVLVACSTGAEHPSASAPSKIKVTSSSIGGGHLAVDYTCEGSGLTPVVSWTGSKQDVSFVLSLTDPDAPGGRFVHWVAFGI